MNPTLWLLAAAGVYAATRLGRTAPPPPPRTSWDVPPAQQEQIDRLTQAAQYYRDEQPYDARVTLTGRHTDWAVIRAAAKWSRDPLARRAGAALEDRGPGAFTAELHRCAPGERDALLAALSEALREYTGPGGARP